LPDNFPTQNGLKQADTLLPRLSTMLWNMPLESPGKAFQLKMNRRHQLMGYPDYVNLVHCTTDNPKGKHKNFNR
jgi:hypothetical protein